MYVPISFEEVFNSSMLIVIEIAQLQSQIVQHVNSTVILIDLVLEWIQYQYAA